MPSIIQFCRLLLLSPPPHSTLRFDAWIDKVDKRKVFLKGSITTFDLQTVHSDASGLWVISNGLSSIGNCWKEIIEKDNYRFEQKKIRILGDHFPRSDAVFSSTKPSLVPSGALVSASPPAITLSSPSSTSSSSFPSVKPSLTLATPSGNFHMHTAFRSCL